MFMQTKVLWGPVPADNHRTRKLSLAKKSRFNLLYEWSFIFLRKLYDDFLLIHEYDGSYSNDSK